MIQALANPKRFMEFSRIVGRRVPLRVTSVIEDLPAKTPLQVTGFVSGSPPARD